jgi:hypothetical protein
VGHAQVAQPAPDIDGHDILVFQMFEIAKIASPISFLFKRLPSTRKGLVRFGKSWRQSLQPEHFRFSSKSGSALPFSFFRNSGRKTASHFCWNCFERSSAMNVHNKPNAPVLDSYWMPFTANRQFKAAPRLLAAAEGMYYTAPH